MANARLYLLSMELNTNYLMADDDQADNAETEDDEMLEDEEETEEELENEEKEESEGDY